MGPSVNYYERLCLSVHISEHLANSNFPKAGIMVFSFFLSLRKITVPCELGNETVHRMTSLMRPSEKCGLTPSASLLFDGYF